MPNSEWLPWSATEYLAKVERRGTDGHWCALMCTDAHWCAQSALMIIVGADEWAHQWWALMGTDDHRGRRYQGVLTTSADEWWRRLLTSGDGECWGRLLRAITEEWWRRTSLRSMATVNVNGYRGFLGDGISECQAECQADCKRIAHHPGSNTYHHGSAPECHGVCYCTRLSANECQIVTDSDGFGIAKGQAWGDSP